ncbi:glycosyltransferase family 4 protein [Leeuwenhoekiella palythoae]|uniref:glycosyltransferase family 4 protein n=1 Tax=Leeuwenhoekiella TaxID=283735 RepID=UPI001431B79A|nr:MULTISPECIES: glycosyltransferase family 4 protein [Leeuwenhoekiella]UBZ11053.1 glycosyltransferase family 4 protein [Leeuwenhoekiella palythoae]
MIRQTTARQVITVGSQYKDHRGGIGGVIERYSKHFEVFNYVCTYGVTTNKITIIWNFLKATYLLSKRLIQNPEIQIVHIHGAAKGSVIRKYVLFNLCQRILKRKVVFHCHASEMEVFYKQSPSIIRWILKDFFNNTTAIICLSKSWEHFFTTNFTPKKLFVLENIVDDPIDHTLNTLPPTSPLKVLFLGAVGTRKGIFDLLQVLADNRSFYQDKILLTVGGNGEIERLEAFIIENNLEKVVKFEGWVSGVKKVQLLKETDIYILPSYNEGLPLSVLEAMSYSKPIISTYAGGIPEIVKPKVNGILVNPGNTREIDASLKTFIDNPQLIQVYGEASQEMVQAHYAKQVMPKLEYIYNKILGVV